MGRRHQDTSRLWLAVAAAAVAVVALFIIDPLGRPMDDSGSWVDDDAPFVAIIAADEQPADQVLGQVTIAQP